jgi:arginyl-tRNA synthetase
VHREFYYNDAGVQIQTLASSTQLRAKGFKPGDDCWPSGENAAAYNGDYIADIAADFLAGRRCSRMTAASPPRVMWMTLDDMRLFAVAYLRHEQDLDLQAFA